MKVQSDCLDELYDHDLSDGADMPPSPRPNSNMMGQSHATDRKHHRERSNIIPDRNLEVVDFPANKRANRFDADAVKTNQESIATHLSHLNA